jgi:hypothetical protein
LRGLATNIICSFGAPQLEGSNMARFAPDGFLQTGFVKRLAALGDLRSWLVREALTRVP